MAPRLALEVLELIIDELAEYNDNHNDNHSSIKACALVCHSFLPLCRKHIFAYVTLNARSLSSPTSDDLNHFLSNSPHLAVYIRKLDYNVSKKEFLKKRYLWLLPMFKKLVKLQKLEIGYTYFTRCKGLDWMSSSVRKVLLPLLHFPTLNSIKLSSILNFPLADLAGCVNLKKLEISSLECSNDVGIFLEALPPTPAMLERLAINVGNIKPVQQLCDARRPDGKPIIDFSSLKEVRSFRVRLHSMTELFGICRYLHKINLTIEREASSDPSDSTSCLKGLFTMLKPSLPTLVDIDILCFINNDEDETRNGPLAGLCHELEKMVGQNVVETIKLMIWLQPGYDCTRWGELDDVLMGSPEDWPALREVSLLFLIIRTSGDDLDKALRELPMTKLVESKRVQFDLTVRVLNF